MRSEDGLDNAIHYSQSATKKNSQYALAYFGLADCYGILGAAIVVSVPRTIYRQARILTIDPTM